MMDTSLINTIQTWFDTEWGGSMVLPDGWFGRPYDNQHALTSVQQNGSSLILVLDEILHLHFEGLQAVRVGEHELVFGPFDKLRFEWTPYGGGKLTTQEYLTGEVKIVSPEAAASESPTFR
jgi:hypothetical protein